MDPVRDHLLIAKQGGRDHP